MKYRRAVISTILVFSSLVAPLAPVFAEDTETPPVVSPPAEPAEETDPSSADPETPAEPTTPDPEATVPETPPTDEASSEEDETAAPETLSLNNSEEGTTAPKDQTQKNKPKIDTDGNSGALVYSYPIIVPPGRNGMTPDVALVYNSNNATKDSIVGSGWSVSIPSIERINRKGINTIFTDDYFTSSLDGELVSIGGGLYGAKDEGGNFLKYAFANNVWTVTDKSGTVYKFGQTASARQDNPSDATKVFKWMLEEVRDTNGNYISYEYYKDAGQIYPSKIIYTGNGSTPGIFTVNFDRVTKSSVPISYATGFSVKLNYRISEIRTEINGVWTRKYTLSYTTGDNGVGSLLDTVTESGQDDSGATTTLPEINFDYQTGTKGWTYAPSTNFPITFVNSDGFDIGSRMDDINSDGLPDILCHNDITSGTPCDRTNPKVYLNNGAEGWTDVSSTWLFPTQPQFPFTVETFLNHGEEDTGLRVFDINADGLTDLVYGGVTGGTYIYLNTGSGWAYSSSLSLNSPLQFISASGRDSGIRMGDINGDGLLDFVCHNENTDPIGSPCPLGHPKVYLNNGSGGWIDVSGTWSIPQKANAPTKTEVFLGRNLEDRGLRLLDINGDGLADLVHGDGTGRYVYLNTGSAWIYTPSFTFPIAFVISAGTNATVGTGAQIADINGDSLPDVFCNNEVPASYCTSPLVYLNNGIGGWTDVSSTWLFPARVDDPSKKEAFLNSSSRDRGLRIVDINGNGFSDLVRAQKTATSSYAYVYLNNGNIQPDLLTKVTRAQGGNTTITYKATPLFRDGSNNLLNPKMPMIVDVVSQITNNDALGVSETYTYQYASGTYYFNTPLDRKFAGFNTVTKTDAAGNKVITYYHQGNTTDSTNGEYDDHISKAGRVYRTEIKNSADNTYSISINKWDRFDLGGGRNFLKNIRSTELTYDANPTHKDTATEYTYDNANGNLLAQSNLGEVTGANNGTYTDVGTDKRVTTYTYTTNSTPGVNVPSSAILTDNASIKVAESKFYYDTLPYGSVDKGNRTKVEQWKSGSTYINSQKAYNAYGLMTSTTDPRGKVTSYTYDTSNLYPATVKNPLNQTIQYTYDYSSGKIKQVTDANNFIYQTVLDGLDRMTEVKVPDLAAPYTPVTKTRYTYTDTPGAVAVQRSDYLDTATAADTYQYFDGLGRLIQERKEAEGAGQFNVRDLAYDSRGLLQKESLPYAATGSAKMPPTTSAALYTTYTYDTLERPLTVSNALGTTNYLYDDWKTTITDANNKSKSYSKDAFGNLITVNEINGAATYTTNYQWNLNGNLTKITDALSNVRNFVYDALGRRTSAEDLHAPADATFGTWAYSYDDAGNLTQSIDPNAQTVNYTYSDLNQVLTEDYIGSSGTEISYGYNNCSGGIGKLCTVSMPSGANMTYTYNSNGTVTSEAKVIIGTTYTTSYTYDRQGNPLTITYPDNAQAKYTFNTAGLLEKIERKEGGGAFTPVISNLDYSPMGQITTQAYPNTITTTNTYNPAKLYRLTRRLTQTATSTKLQDLNYTYDNVGNITKIVDASNTASAKTISYVYDGLYRLTSATATSTANGQNYTQAFTYDAIGNILTGPVTGGYLGTYFYQGNTGNLKANPHAVTSISGGILTYDPNGNLLTGGPMTNTWNYRNELTKTTIGTTTTTSALYDHNGDRVKYVRDAVTTVYPTKSYTTEGTKNTKQIYAGDQLVATIETVASTTTPYYVHSDHLGSTNVVSNGTGASVEVLDYYPYGTTRIASGTYTPQRQYIGQVADLYTGLDYLNARYYIPLVGRFVSQDPVFWILPPALLLDPQQANSYSYARNNPIILSDPSGLRTIIVPGTFNDSKKSKSKIWSENGKASKFINRVGKTFGEKPELFRWSGVNNDQARKEAASELVAMINDPNYAYKDGEKLNIIAHSHGGNVAILASNDSTLNRRIDNLVTLGTPNRTVYQSPGDKVANHINVYSRFDMVQNAGEWGDPLTVSGVDERKFDGATNIGVGLRAGIFPFGSHTNLWENKSVWSLVDAHIPKSSW